MISFINYAIKLKVLNLAYDMTNICFSVLINTVNSASVKLRHRDRFVVSTKDNHCCLQRR